MPQRPLAVELTTRLYTEVRPDEVCNENRCYQKRKDSRITRFDLIWIGVRLRNGREVLIRNLGLVRVFPPCSNYSPHSKYITATCFPPGVGTR